MGRLWVRIPAEHKKYTIYIFKFALRWVEKFIKPLPMTGHQRSIQPYSNWVLLENWRFVATTIKLVKRSIAQLVGMLAFHAESKGSISKVYSAFTRNENQPPRELGNPHFN